MMFYEQEQEKLERERRKQELQAELMRNDKIIDRKADELTDILDRKIQSNTIMAKTFTDISEKVEAIADKMYNALDMLREVEKLHPEIKAVNDRYEEAIHDLEDIIKEIQEKTVTYHNEADRLISERKAELSKELDEVTGVPAYHRQPEQQEKRKSSNEIER